MTNPARCDLTIARNEPFGRVWRLTYQGATVDLTGWTGLWQWRLYEGQVGAAALSLGSVTSDVEGVRCTDVGVQLIVAQATLEALPAAAAPSDPRRPDNVIFAHDLILIDPTGLRQRGVAGLITLHSGVTL